MQNYEIYKHLEPFNFLKVQLLCKQSLQQNTMKSVLNKMRIRRNWVLSLMDLDVPNLIVLIMQNKSKFISQLIL